MRYAESGDPRVTVRVLSAPVTRYVLEITGAPDMTGQKRAPHYLPYRFAPEHVQIDVQPDGSWAAYVSGGRRLSNGTVSTTTREGRRFTSGGSHEDLPVWLDSSVRDCVTMTKEAWE